MPYISEYRAKAPIERVEVKIFPGEDTIPLKEAKDIVEQYIANDTPVTIVHGKYSRPVDRGIYLLYRMGEKLQTIIMLRALAYQVRVLGDQVYEG